MISSAFRPISKKNSNSLQNRKRREYAQFEALESRTLLSSTVYVAPGMPDATHFQTLQAALAVAVTGDTVILQPGFSGGSFVTTHLSQIATAGATSIHTAVALDVGDVITIGTNTNGDIAERNIVTAITASAAGDFIITLASPLSAAHNGSIVDATNGTQGPTIGLSAGITLTAQAGAVLPFNLEIWPGSTATTLSQVNMGSFTLFIDSNGNTISDSTLRNVVVKSGAQANIFSGNTFNIVAGNGPILDHADHTIMDGNTINVTSASAVGLTVLNSAGIVITNNIINTAAGGTGIVISVADAQFTTVDIRDNILTATDGTGISLTKSGLGSTLQARLQGNDFRNNAIGVRITGDGASAGNIDLGGGNTVLGSSSGHNNFSSFNSADATHFAIGLFNTNVGALIRAAGNTFTTLNPFEIVADTFNTPAAGGSGVILATGSFSFDYIFANGNQNTIDTATFSGTLAPFTGFLSHVASDFNVAINWGDGTASTGTVGGNESGFSVNGSHAWTAAGTYTVTVVIESTTGGSAVVFDTADVTPTTPSRNIALQGVNLASLQFEIFTGNVATFTDSMTGTTPSDYAANITWSDGLVTAGTIIANNDGSFSISTSRAFNTAGNLTATVALETTDGLDATANIAATINPRVLTLHGTNITMVQGGTFNGTVASFTDNKTGTIAANYLATIAWSDGTASTTTIAANSDGSFSIISSRAFLEDGAVSATITLQAIDTKVTTSTSLTATVQQRQLTLDTIDISVKKNTTFNGVVATFTDNLFGTLASGYTVSIAWSDGKTTAGTINKNADGSFAISTSRSFPKAGTVTGSITISTTDGSFTGSADLTANVSNDNCKVPPGQWKRHHWRIRFCHVFHGKGAPGSCHR
jgi:hypothetical protein